MDKSNLWILTEERPKNDVVRQIIERFIKDHKIACFIDKIRILPILNGSNAFSFTYEVKGIDSKIIDAVYIKIVSGYSSFVDFLIFYQDNAPTNENTPLYAIEETKTDDTESRNTGVYQRASKFVYISDYYPNVKKMMLYNTQVDKKKKESLTNFFGTRCLMTLGVEILGKETLNVHPFESVDEVIELKNSMPSPPKGNVPIKITKSNNLIQISGRLVKGGSLSHDPNVGALSLIAATLRVVGWQGRLEITKHGLENTKFTAKNKFVRICNKLDIALEGLSIPESGRTQDYWKYDSIGEKNGTIFIHLVVEAFSQGFSIYENHAGCERGYFITAEGKHLAVERYSNKQLYKAGDKSKIIKIPDLVLADISNLKIINIEGKKFSKMMQGIEDINNFTPFEDTYIKKYYPKYKIVRTVVLYGGDKKTIERVEVSFLLNSKGDMILGVKAPELFTEAIKNLLDYWRA